MRIGYLLLVHEFENNVKNLISSLLRDPECCVFVHVDKTVNLKNFFINHERVHYSIRRYVVTWGGYNMVRATLQLISLAQKCEVDYYCLLSGRDVVMHAPVLLRKKCENMYPISMVDGDTVVNRWTERGLDRTKYYFFYIFKNKRIAYLQNRFVRFFGKVLRINRKMPYQMTPYCGSQWWCISDKHMNYILYFLETHKKFSGFYKTVGIPDEQFFHTILLNSEVKNQIINESPTYVRMIDGIVKCWSVHNIKEADCRDSFFIRKIEKDDSLLYDFFLERIKWEEENGQYYVDGAV